MSFVMHTLLATRPVLQRVAVGAAQQNINQGVLKAHGVVIPPETLAQAFTESADVLFSRRASLVAESAQLVSMRDTLLPKLLSGELRVNSAEKSVAEAL